MEAFFEGAWWDFLEGFFLAASFAAFLGLGIFNNYRGRERKRDPFDKVDDGPVDPQHPLSEYEF
ncbi:MAG: hypothetical protein GXP06_04720 [Alphaproteobacteria bacterium]|nr:hypothetical protein [Alphaproteobacteria bacterium]